MKILTAEQMRRIDQITTERFGLASLILMENAGRHVAEVLMSRYGHLRPQIAILCGKGNNGGDGLVAARHLIMRNLAPDIYLFARKEEVKGDAKINLDILEAMRYPIREVNDVESWQAISATLSRYEVIVDALLGTGLTKPVSGLYEAVIKSVNALRKAKVIAVDIPSGLSADSGELIGEAIRADVTVTFTAPKVAHVFGRAALCSGELLVVQIGSPKELLETEDLYLNLITEEQVRQQIPTRERDTHKGTYGHILVIAGSEGKTGAAAMTAIAALRSGAGLATVATARSARPIVASFFVELMTESLPETDAGSISEEGVETALALLSDKDVLALGPGLSTHPSTVKFVHEVVRRSPVPVVIDADGINAYAGQIDKLRNDNDQPIVISPHPGEMARLLGTTAAEVQSRRVETARSFAMQRGTFVVLKGYRTLVADRRGRVYVNPTGNPGMATGGSGDILTGMLASFVARSRPIASDESLCYRLAAAVYLHGLAGDLAAQALGEEPLVASDILRFLPEAYRKIRG